MVYITGIRLGLNGHNHSHITHVRWTNGEKTDISTVAQMVKFIDDKNEVRVKVVTLGGQVAEVPVSVVKATPPYLRTNGDQTTADNLLSLPRI